jgi:hypothetical protein
MWGYARLAIFRRTRQLAVDAKEALKGPQKLNQPAIVGIFGVNSTESNREQSGINGGQLWGATV